MPEDTNPQPSLNKKPLSWKNILIGVVIGTVIVGLGVLIFLLLQPKPETTTTVTAKKATSSAKISTPPAKKDETAGWETYTTKKPTTVGFSYSIKYPTTLKKGSDYDEPYSYSSKFSNYKETGNYGASACEGEGKDDCFTISLDFQDKGSPTPNTYEFVNGVSVGSSKNDNNVTGMGTIIYTRHKNVSEGGYTWLNYSAERGGEWPLKYLYGFALKKEGRHYYLELTSNSEPVLTANKELLKKILSTFRFE